MASIDDTLADVREATTFGNPGFFQFPRVGAGFPDTEGLKFGALNQNMVLDTPNCNFIYTIVGGTCFFTLNYSVLNKGTSVGNAVINMNWGAIARWGFTPFDFNTPGGIPTDDTIVVVESMNMTGFVQCILELTGTGFIFHAMPANGSRTVMNQTFFASPCAFRAVGSFLVRFSF